MKLKVDEQGHVVVNDGMPVYVYEDGKESPFDAEAATAKISELNAESKDRRLKLKDYEEKLKGFEGIEDPAKALKALETVKNLKDKQLIDAGEVETLKKMYQSQVEEKEAQLKKAYDVQIARLTDELKAKDSSIYNMMVNEQFQKSPYFVGDDSRTILTPDIAAEYFGKNFRVEEKGGKLRVTGYVDNEPILSREKVGETADFNEAIGVILEKYPMKDRILRGAPGGGPEASGNASLGGKKTIDARDSEAFSKNLDAIAKGEIKAVL